MPDSVSGRQGILGRTVTSKSIPQGSPAAGGVSGPMVTTRLLGEALRDLTADRRRKSVRVCTNVAQTGGILEAGGVRAPLERGEPLVLRVGRAVHRYFCKRCGIHCFARGNLAELGSAYISVDYNCLDGVELRELQVIYRDGRHNNRGAGPRQTP